jgi:hypothetical protein
MLPISLVATVSLLLLGRVPRWSYTIALDIAAIGATAYGLFAAITTGMNFDKSLPTKEFWLHGGRLTFNGTVSFDEHVCSWFPYADCRPRWHAAPHLLLLIVAYALSLLWWVPLMIYLMFAFVNRSAIWITGRCPAFLFRAGAVCIAWFHSFLAYLWAATDAVPLRTTVRETWFAGDVASYAGYCKRCRNETDIRATFCEVCGQKMKRVLLIAPNPLADSAP